MKQCIVARGLGVNKDQTYMVIDDPEELLTMTLDKKGEAGLWFVAAAMHYNVTISVMVA
jgi:hypothetical protein